MMESKSAASVSPTLAFNLDNGASFTFNFQADSRVTLIGFQEGRAVTGVFTVEQIEELRNTLNAFLEKRKG